MSINEIKNISEFEKIISENKLTLADFYADWCGPCKMVEPIIDELSKEHNDINFIKINVDKLQELAKNYEILSIPTFIIFKNGNELKRKNGFVTRDEINKDLLS